ncbi:alpha/beta fold hydrolase [Bradyrhizobium ivorense]|uniref:alpha/beta fold hydrolase n=1 Tax=Bradyrhizobium ivorense TaxID=2511166 RepID=UPI0010B9AEE6|nr:alpha/beta hydrolase [Bradyrhizobium ivorense]VIO67016.1 Pimeloyl-[acyl-carrier protein] methyl ester esterase [Bradyrhizobium ivorense]
MSRPGAIPVVLLPGMDGTGELLKGLAERLATHRPVQLLSYPRDRSLGYAELTDYVAERAPDAPFVILGESFSGPIAIELAATDQRVAGLVLVSSFARHPLPAQLAAFVRALDVRWLPKRLVTAALMGATATPELSARLHDVLATLPRKILQDRAREALGVDKCDRLRRISCPMLCLYGRDDRLTGKRQVTEIVAARPRCQVHWLDASHMLLATQPEAAVEVINGFCTPLDRP